MYSSSWSTSIARHHTRNSKLIEMTARTHRSDDVDEYTRLFAVYSTRNTLIIAIYFIINFTIVSLLCRLVGGHRLFFSPNACAANWGENEREREKKTQSTKKLTIKCWNSYSLSGKLRVRPYGFLICIKEQFDFFLLSFYHTVFAWCFAKHL